MADSIQKYALGQDSWDISHVQVALDGRAIDLFGNDTRASVSLSNDKASWQINADGEGVKILSHNDSGDITINVSRLSAAWQYVLANQDSMLRDNHSISIHTDAETTLTSTAVLGRLPNPDANNEPGSLGLAFHCKNISVNPIKQS